MCGLVGTLSFADTNFAVEQDYLIRMRDTMTHRGPDGAGCWISDDRKIGLAHRRLAIIDLSSNAAQPMSTPDGRYWIAFNGEVYNHAALRRELKLRGRTVWKTDHSDTEVVVQAFAEWGIKCLDKFRGMFAFAIWDTQLRELHLVRDRMGIKPLYWSKHHGRLTFASEIKALLADPDQRRAVNEEGLFHYLSFLTTPAPQTMFEGIYKLPPGTYQRVDQHGNMQEQMYYDVWDHTRPMETPDEEELALRIREELRTSVSYRKVGDVPVGVFLSGGIDSSTNAALFSDNGRHPIKTFTIGYEGEYDSYKSEMHYARMMAKRVNAEHHELKLNVDHLLDFLPQMIRLQDEPIGDPVCVPVYYLSKLARENGVTVCQVGEGADELFWGYPTWRVKLRLQKFDALPVPRFLKRQMLLGMKACGMQQSNRYEALRRANDSQPIFWGGVDAFTQHAKEGLLSADMQQRFRGQSSWSAIKPIHDRFMEKAWERSDLNWMSYFDLSMRIPELLLMRVDKMSMGVGLEGRVPFLDHKFVELAMSIPERTKTRGGTLKHILKKAVRGVIPDELIDRPKQGFGVPVYEWLFDKLGDRTRLELDSFCRETNFLNQSAVMDTMHQGGAKSWYLLNLALWWKEYIA